MLTIKPDEQNRITLPKDMVLRSNLKSGSLTGIFFDPTLPALYFEQVDHQKKGGKCVGMYNLDTKNRISIPKHILNLISTDESKDEFWIYLSNNRIHFTLLKRKP